MRSVTAQAQYLSTKWNYTAYVGLAVTFPIPNVITLPTTSFPYLNDAVNHLPYNGFAILRRHIVRLHGINVPRGLQMACRPSMA